MTRAEILAEIKQLERQKAQNPQIAVGLDIQITALCDRLKSIQSFEPRKVV